MINPIAQKKIESISNISNQIQPVVVISCLIFNHELYLKDALEGFVM